MRRLFLFVMFCQFLICRSQLNGNFEVWSYHGPDNWRSSDRNYIGPDSNKTCLQSNDACNGNFSILLKTKLRDGGISRGFIFQNAGINWRPKYLQFCYKSSTITDDSGFIGVSFTNKDSALFSWIAWERILLAPMPIWTESQISINWRNNAMPDSFFMSIYSGSGKRVNDLYIDDIRFSNYALKQSEISKLALDVFVNNDKKLIIINPQQLEITKLEIYQPNGLLLKVFDAHNSHVDMDLTNFDSGVYLLRFTTRDGFISRKILFE